MIVFLAPVTMVVVLRFFFFRVFRCVLAWRMIHVSQGIREGVQRRTTYKCALRWLMVNVMAGHRDNGCAGTVRHERVQCFGVRQGWLFNFCQLSICHYITFYNATALMVAAAVWLPLAFCERCLELQMNTFFLPFTAKNNWLADDDVAIMKNQTFFSSCHHGTHFFHK